MGLEGIRGRAVVLLRVVTDRALLHELYKPCGKQNLDVMANLRGVFAETLANLRQRRWPGHEHAQQAKTARIRNRAQLLRLLKRTCHSDSHLKEGSG